MSNQDQIDSIIEELQDLKKSIQIDEKCHKEELEKYQTDKKYEELRYTIEKQSKNSIAILTDKETKLRKEFEHKHYESCMKGNKVKSSRGFIYQIGYNGIGHEVKVKCPICNEEQDITDIEAW